MVDENGVLLDGTMYHPSRDVLTKRLQQESTVAVSGSVMDRSARYTHTMGVTGLSVLAVPMYFGTSEAGHW